MLSLKRANASIALVEYTAPEKDWPELLDYNPVLHRFDVIRNAYLVIPIGWSTDRLREWLRDQPEAMIFNTISHDPILSATDKALDIPLIADEQRIIIDGLPYIDMFGFYTYIASRVSWDQKSDVDLRFNAHRYPYEILEPELMVL